MLARGLRHAREEQVRALEALEEIDEIRRRCGIWFRDSEERQRRRLHNAKRYIARSSWDR